MSRDDLSGGDFERRKQCCGAMPLVIVALAGQGAAIGQLQYLADRDADMGLRWSAPAAVTIASGFCEVVR
jgi:hypothetical protein